MTMATLTLSACQDGAGPFGFLKTGGGAAGGAGAAADTPDATGNSVRLVDRDVEAPDVFQVTESALWDGRPSLGGVWVAFPDVTEPERVIIRNPANGKFVIGALFRRERDNPGPRLQLSSDAAAALDILAGQPTKLNVTALRREEAKSPPPAADKPRLDANEQIDTKPLDPVAANADAAIAAAEAANGKGKAPDKGKDKGASAAPPPAPAPAAPPATGAAPAKPFLQIGIFSVEENANRAAATLKKAGLTAKVSKEASQGKTFWRVTAGPASSAADAAALKAKVGTLGYGDAYFVTK